MYIRQIIIPDVADVGRIWAVNMLLSGLAINCDSDLCFYSLFFKVIGTCCSWTQ